MKSVPPASGSTTAYSRDEIERDLCLVLAKRRVTKSVVWEFDFKKNRILFLYGGNMENSKEMIR